MLPLRFNFKQLADLNEDLKKSPRALAAISRRVLTENLRKIRKELSGGIPLVSGRLRRSLRVVGSAKARQGLASGAIGFFGGRGISAATAIAGNVLQHPGATPKKRAFLWVPVGNNRGLTGGAAITPAQFFDLPNTFVRDTPKGHRVAFQRINESIIPLFVLQRAVKFSAPPIPIAERVEQRLPDITDEIEDTITQVIAAKKTFEEAIKGS